MTTSLQVDFGTRYVFDTSRRVRNQYSIIFITNHFRLLYSFSQACDGDHHKQEEDGVGRQALPRRVRERGLAAGRRRHVVQEQQIHGQDGFKGTSLDLIHDYLFFNMDKKLAVQVSRVPLS